MKLLSVAPIPIFVSLHNAPEVRTFQCSARSVGLPGRKYQRLGAGQRRSEHGESRRQGFLPDIGDNDSAWSASRRTVIMTLPILVVDGGGGVFLSPPPPSHAVMSNRDNVFEPGQKLGVTAAKARFQDARNTLAYLVDHFDEVAPQGGDNVRRYLGTVGTTSSLYGITKVLKELQEEAHDVVEYTENMSDFNYYLTAAESAAYSSIFVETSASSITPAKYLNDAQRAAQRMQEYMDNMAKELGL